ncbi:hypothetical protein C8K66_101404 [Pseudomonas sp. GV105]|uniref:hypothetical protein n=1 Tax=Pseudomonas sp. GV105 TaxID=2135759 RepID=UPI000D3540E5|nr:hypothetical protein [Pseudomonas sp. GV105]PUB37698.1 hypothetical protein C8K66_101404 [Pseudomonas sp. GV105]
MNNNFRNFIEANKILAMSKDVNWDIPTAPDGTVKKGEGWPLFHMADNPRVPYWLADFGTDIKCLALINEERSAQGVPAIARAKLTNSWQDLIKACAIHYIYVKGVSAAHASQYIVRTIRIIASCCGKAEPWELSVDHIATALKYASLLQPSGQLARGIRNSVQHIFDFHCLVDRTPLLPAVSVKRGNSREDTSNFRQNLSERKRTERLPDYNAFWELIRIVFTEDPQTFYDELRFAQAKILVLCGLRMGEAPLIPVDWCQEFSHRSKKGIPASEFGGISSSIALRYFVEKRSISDKDGKLLHPDIQHIPEMFREIIIDFLNRVLLLTQPLRATLEKQYQSNRILADFQPEELVAPADLYPYLTGNPFVYEDDDEVRLTAQYRKNYDISVLDEIESRQLSLKERRGKLKNVVRQYFAVLRRGYESLTPFRTVSGVPCKVNFRKGYFKVSELEQLVRLRMPSKISPLKPLRTTAGSIPPHHMLFLAPIRALSEGRNDGLCDIRKYCFIGILDTVDLRNHYYKSQTSNTTFFQRYGRNEENQGLTINSHSFRHVQNSELFRMGVADTIITKRYGRRSVEQSYRYDHRSLLEELASMDLPQTAHDILPIGGSQVLAMILSGKVSGPIVDEFREIQATRGDEAAFLFLAGEADGFHVTPYGFCINSFMTNPCPKHLECYGGCRHLCVTDLKSHQQNLFGLREKIALAVNKIEARFSDSIGRTNQLDHAKKTLENIDRALACRPGEKPFPDGPDLSVPVHQIDLFKN